MQKQKIDEMTKKSIEPTNRSSSGFLGKTYELYNSLKANQTDMVHRRDKLMLLQKILERPMYNL